MIAYAIITGQQHQVLMALRIMQKATGSQLIRYIYKCSIKRRKLYVGMPYMIPRVNRV